MTAGPFTSPQEARHTLGSSWALFAMVSFWFLITTTNTFAIITGKDFLILIQALNLIEIKTKVRNGISKIAKYDTIQFYFLRKLQLDVKKAYLNSSRNIPKD